MAEPVRLTDGDFVLLPGGQAMRLFSSPEVPPTDAMRLFMDVPVGESTVLNGGGGCAGVGGHFAFEGLCADRLLMALPPVVRVGADADKAALRQSVDRLMRELREPQAGSCLFAMHLAQNLMVDALRHQLRERPVQGSGWLAALADPRMHAVISAMHGQPARRWTLAAFARIAGMSRSSFAAGFRRIVGEPAMDYLTRWRMLVAADRLAHSGMPIAAVAPTVGYLSESAFGATFKRVIGCSPKQYVRRMETDLATRS